ncbi:MAG: transporter ATP-binding protein [Anaerocolumna sp.]|jgi:ABC-type bacteriocin/lantibiotic exporter with double-glycine peptidase domain|nr:transporter ATP-binding protein [Anaerocolumna sp.]
MLFAFPVGENIAAVKEYDESSVLRCLEQAGMSSCRFCDDILVLKKGEVAERGGHVILLEKDGIYAKLWKAQAKYYA